MIMLGVGCGPQVGPFLSRPSKVVAYDPRRHQGMTLRRRWSRHLRASSPLDRQKEGSRVSLHQVRPSSRHDTFRRARARGAIFSVFYFIMTLLARMCLSGPLHVFLSLFRPLGGFPFVSGP